ncbi:MAG: OmpA family protein [Chitinophagaceae bacterium]
MKRLFSTLIILLVVSPVASQPRSYTIQNNELKTGIEVVFKAGTDILDVSSDPPLHEVKSYLTDKKAITLLRIEAHVAAGGDENKNLGLTKKRALAVAKWLVQIGVDSSRIIAVAFGSAKPIADNGVPEGKMLNTRISFVNAAMLKHPIGAMPVDVGGVVVCNPCSF